MEITAPSAAKFQIRMNFGRGHASNQPTNSLPPGCLTWDTRALPRSQTTLTTCDSAHGFRPRVLSKNTSYISRLDHLRFLAAFVVIAYHCAGAVVPEDAQNPFLVILRVGETGVGLFMVLSGFILTRISLGKEIRYGSFLYNRLLRIYPLYVFAIVAAAYTGGRHMDPLSLVSMLLGIGVVGGVTLPKFGQMWTVAVECQFYLIFPLILRFLNKHGVKYIIGLIALVVFVRMLAYGSDGTTKDAAYWTIWGRLDQFLVGMLAAVVFTSKNRFLSSPLAFALALLAVYLWALGWWNWSGGYYGKNAETNAGWIVSPLLEATSWALLALTYLEQRWPINSIVDRVLSYLGTISFSLYVWHVPIMAAVKHYPHLLYFSEWYWNFALITCPAIVALSSLSYFVIEKPFFALRKTYTAPEPSVPKLV